MQIMHWTSRLATAGVKGLFAGDGVWGDVQTSCMIRASLVGWGVDADHG
jgi:hypothetical protein